MARENREMEKKAASSPARLTSSESKGKDNGRGNGNKAQRHNGKGKREPGDPTNNQSRRPAPQKSRAMDKRPRSRGLPGSRRDEVTVAQRAEFGSALPGGPRKINLNHLINFTFAPREAEENRGSVGWRYKGRWSNRHPRYNKEQFLQANCQFVVKASGDYKQQSTDPDKIVEWDLIEQVRMLGHEMPSCPICLYPPTAAKITLCGHIYCWPCILHYISLGDKKWRKCPICYEAVMASDLKSVVAKSVKMYSVGDSVTLRLMKREKGSVIIQPHHPDISPVDAPTAPCLKDVSEENCFSKLMVASPSEVKELILQRELRELEKQLKGSDEEFERSFIQRALDLLKERDSTLAPSLDAASKAVLEAVEDAALVNVSSASVEEEPTVTPVKSLPIEDRIVYSSAFSDEEAEEEEKPKEIQPAAESATGDARSPQPDMPASANPEEGEEPETKADEIPLAGETSDDVALGEPGNELTGPNVSSSLAEEGDGVKYQGVDKTDEGTEQPSPGIRAIGKERKTSSGHGNTIYFYQAEDGQHLYLGALNARCMAHEYRGLEHCPVTITAKVVEMEHVSITQDLRNRMRHLQHLPLTCEVSVCELDLRSPTISHKTLGFFRTEIQKKKQKRDKKARDEKKRERKISQEQDRQNGVYPNPKYSLKSTNQFPSFGPGSGTSPGAGSTYSPGPPRSISPVSVDSAASSTYSAPLSDHQDEDLLFGSIHDAVQQPPTQAVEVPMYGGAVGGWPAVGSPDSQAGQRSFAQMLRTGAAKPASPMKSYASSSQAMSSSYGRPANNGSSDSDHDENYVPVPQYKDAFSNAIQDALDKAALMSLKKGEEGEGDAGKSSGGRKNKKGRKKQQLLFSTAGPRFK